MSTWGWAQQNSKIAMEPKGKKFRKFEWEKIMLNEDRWMKLRHYQSGYYLTLNSTSERNIYFYPNIKPCQGQKPCLRYSIVNHSYTNYIPAEPESNLKALICSYFGLVKEIMRQLNHLHWFFTHFRMPLRLEQDVRSKLYLKYNLGAKGLEFISVSDAETECSQKGLVWHDFKIDHHSRDGYKVINATTDQSANNSGTVRLKHKITGFVIESNNFLLLKLKKIGLWIA